MPLWRRPKGRHAQGASVPVRVPARPVAELTFRDGSRATLDPVQARALGDIADALTQRDEVKP